VRQIAGVALAVSFGIFGIFAYNVATAALTAAEIANKETLLTFCKSPQVMLSHHSVVPTELKV